MIIVSLHRHCRINTRLAAFSHSLLPSDHALPARFRARSRCRCPDCFASQFHSLNLSRPHEPARQLTGRRGRGPAVFLAAIPNARKTRALMQRCRRQRGAAARASPPPVLPPRMPRHVGQPRHRRTRHGAPRCRPRAGACLEFPFPIIKRHVPSPSSPRASPLELLSWFPRLARFEDG